MAQASRPSADFSFRSQLDRWSDWNTCAPSKRPLRDTHHAMEINYVEKGAVTYLFGGNILTLPRRRLVLFWGSTPHQVIGCEKNTLHHWMEIPLAPFLQWRLADAWIRRLLAGNLIVEDDPTWQEHDGRAFHRWHQDLKSGSPDHRQIVALEVEARLRRLFASLSRRRTRAGLAPTATNGNARALQKVGKMAAFVAHHCAEPLRLEQIARQASLRADYATTLFKKVTGLSVMDYVAQHRVARARRLLLMTDAKVLDIGLEAGFGSSSRFYEAFSQWCGQSPHQYRKLARKSVATG
jgi:AraC-like DNA-binding protein